MHTTPMERLRYSLTSHYCTDGYTRTGGTYLEPEPDVAGDLVSSELLGCKFHAPVFDIDVACQLRPSKTEGHFHLYCSVPTTWRRYKRAMKAMAKAGIVDQGWVKLAQKRKFGLVCTPITGRHDF